MFEEFNFTDSFLNTHLFKVYTKKNYRRVQ